MSALARFKTPRLAVRAILLHRDRLLLVNAYRSGSDLLCAPGGGVEPGQSLPDNLRREVREECGLKAIVGNPALINEFHDPASGFHQVDIYFRCSVEKAEIAKDWHDPEGIVHHRRFVTREEYKNLRVKPDSLAQVAWGETEGLIYDPLEVIVR